MFKNPYPVDSAIYFSHNRPLRASPLTSLIVYCSLVEECRIPTRVASLSISKPLFSTYQLTSNKCMFSSWSSVICLIHTVHQKSERTIRNILSSPLTASSRTTINKVQLTVIVKTTFEICRLR